MITAPVVTAPGPGEGPTVAAIGADLGWVVAGRHPVGPDRVVVELAPAEGYADPRAVIEALRAAGVAAIGGPAGPGHEVVWANRNAPHWFRPGHAVCFPWSVFARHEAELVIEIDPGTGFGAGSHPTTSLLLRWLTGPDLDLTGQRVLDVGCGTGVLAVAAALLGAGSVAACDIAPAALVATTANAARNGVADRVALVDTELAALTGPFDVAVANIHAPVLTELAPDLRRLVAPGGRLAVSGLSPAQVSAVGAAFAPLELVERLDHDEWTAAVYALS